MRNIAVGCYKRECGGTQHLDYRDDATRALSSSEAEPKRTKHKKKAKASETIEACGKSSVMDGESDHDSDLHKHKKPGWQNEAEQTCSGKTPENLDDSHG